MILKLIVYLLAGMGAGNRDRPCRSLGCCRNISHADHLPAL